ncbi:unnamed protein product [Discosporangium mesarthrocarpum]
MEPHWVSGADGDRISMGHTVLRLERVWAGENVGAPGVGTGVGTGLGDAVISPSGLAGSGGDLKRKLSQPVISKRFLMNPNLFDAIRLSREVESNMRREEGRLKEAHRSLKR